jgi:TMEM175 potassium channel family protein
MSMPVPFPTSVLAAHLGRPGQRAAALLFNGTYFFIALFFNGLWRYAASRRRRLLAPDVDTASVERISYQYAFGPIVYLACVVLSWVSVSASLVLNLALGCFFALPPRLASKVGRQ